MDESRRKAIEILTADPSSRQVFVHFNAAMPLRAGESFADVEDSPRFALPFPEAHGAFKKHRAQFLELLAQAIPDFNMQLPARSILEGAGPGLVEGKLIFHVATVEEIPEKFRSEARALPSGKYRIMATPGWELARAMGDETPAPTVVAAKPVADPLKYEIARETLSADFNAFRELHEKAAAAGRTVRILDYAREVQPWTNAAERWVRA